MRSLFGRRRLVDTDGRHISDAAICASYRAEQPSLDVVRRAIADAVDGICGADITRSIAERGDYCPWGMDVEDAVQMRADAVMHDWIRYGAPKPASLYDILERHILEVKSTAPPQPDISEANRRWLANLFR